MRDLLKRKEIEKILLEAADNKYKYIARNKNGNLVLFEFEPTKIENETINDPIGKPGEVKEPSNIWRGIELNNVGENLKKGLIIGLNVSKREIPFDFSVYNSFFKEIEWENSRATKIIDVLIENTKTKYYEIMEIADNPVGANFYYCTGDKKEEILSKIKGNFDVKEISKDEYEEEKKQIYRKNYYKMTGKWLSEEELTLAYFCQKIIKK